MAEWIGMIGLGLLLTALGVLNLRGDISSIHWYNRQHVTKDMQHAYGKCIGAGTVIIGGCLVLTGILQLAAPAEGWFLILLLGIILGAGVMLYAQLRYNHGIF